MNDNREHQENLFLVFATAWGSRHGGINAFNEEFCRAIARDFSARVVCVCLAPIVPIKDKDDEVELISVGIENRDHFLETDEKRIVELLAERGCQSPLYLAGHDVHTLPIALQLKRAFPTAKVVGFHHMSYRDYKDGPDAHTRQKEAFQRADIVCGIGTRLTRAAEDMRQGNVGTTVLELLPPLPFQKDADAPRRFNVLMYGRIETKNDSLKQRTLCVHAFAEIVRDKQIPHDSVLTLIGVPNTERRDVADYAAKVARIRVTIDCRDYVEDRKALLQVIAEQSVVVVPSIHEGFGLCAWEAVACGTPLIVTKGSGFYDTIEKWFSKPGLACVEAVEVQGTLGKRRRTPNPKDVKGLKVALANIYHQQLAARQNVRFLRSIIKTQPDVVWPSSLRKLANICCIPIKTPFTIALGCGFPDPKLVGRITGQRTPAQEATFKKWLETGRVLADVFNEHKRFRLNYPGVNSGNLATVVVDHIKVHERVTTFYYGEAKTDEEAKAALLRANPSYFEENNGDSNLPYYNPVGRISSWDDSGDRRAKMVQASDALLVVAGSNSVRDHILCAIAHNKIVIGIGCFGGATQKWLEQFVEHNEKLKARYRKDVIDAINALATTEIECLPNQISETFAFIAKYA